MNKLLKLLAEQPNRRRYVELTETGPVLYESDIEAFSINSISTHEVDEATFNDLMARLQTGELDNATVEAIIGIS